MAEKPVSAEKPISNVFHGKITHVEHAPPYEIVTIELDVRQVAELTVAYIAVPGNSIREIAPNAPGLTLTAAAHPATTTPPPPPPPGGSTDGGSGDGSSDGKVTVTVPVPLAFISKGN